MMTGDLLLMVLLMDLQTSALGMGLMAIAAGIVTQPRMAMWVQDQTLAAVAPQTGCHQHHLVPAIGFRLIISFFKKMKVIEAFVGSVGVLINRSGYLHIL